MFGLFLRATTFLGIVSLLNACSGQNQRRPELGPRPALSIERVVLQEKLTPESIKAIFRALNENGELSSLAEWVEGATEAELHFWADWITRWIYQPAFDSDGLLQILKGRVRQQFFSQTGASGEKSYRAGLEIAQLLWARPEFPEFVRKTGTVALIEDSRNPLLAVAPFFTAETAGALVADLQTLKKNGQWPELQTRMQAAFEAGLIQNFAHALRKTHEKSGAFSLLGLQASLQGALAPKQTEEGNQVSAVSRVLKLAALLDRPGKEFFTALKKTLRDNAGAVRSFAAAWDPLLTDNLTGLVRESLLSRTDDLVLDQAFWLSVPRADENSAPTPAFNKLFVKVFSGLEQITDPRRRNEQSDEFFYFLSINLNAWALTSWLEEVVRINRQAIAAIPESAFTEKFWATSWEYPEWSAELVDWTKVQLNPRAERDFAAVGRAVLVERLKVLIPRKEGLGPTRYVFPKPESNLRLEAALTRNLREVHAIRPLADLTPLLVVLARKLTAEDSESFFSLDRLIEKENLLDWINSFLEDLSVADWKRLKQTIFVEWGFRELSYEQQNGILRLFENSEEVYSWVEAILSNLQGIEDIDERLNENQTTVWTLYHRLVRAWPPDTRISLASLLGQLGRAEIMEFTESGPRYPGLHALVQSPVVIELLTDWSRKTEVDFGLFAYRWLELVADHGWEKLGDALGLVLEEKPAALVELLAHLPKGSATITTAERRWMTRFLEEGSLNELRNFFLRHSSKENLQRLISELERLTEQGSWNRALRLLGQIQNERVREGVKILLQMDLSGEWRAALRLLRQGIRH